MMKLILGGGRSCASSFLYKKINQLAMENSHEMFYVIVPEQYTLETQKECVALSANGCILNIDVVSFERLAYKIMEELGINSNNFISEESKTYVIGKAGKTVKNDLKVLGRGIEKIGYIEGVKSIISEFTKYGVTVADIDNISKSTTNKRLVDKLHDINLIRDAYINYIEGNSVPKEEMLISLSSRLGESNTVKHATFAFAGFTGFTPDQMKFMEGLLKVSNDIYVAITYPTGLDYNKARTATDTFELSRQSIVNLKKLCEDNEIQFEVTDRLVDHTYNCRNFLMEAATPRAEIEAVKHEIIKLIEDGYSYSDIGVVCLNVDLYKKYFQEIFSENKIPFFVDDRQSLLEHSFSQYFRYALQVKLFDYSRDSVFKYLKSGYSDIDFDDICYLENYVTALGIRGYKKWHETFARIPRYVKEEDRDSFLEKINCIREAFIKETDGLIAGLKAATVFSQYNKALKEFFIYRDMENKLIELSHLKEDQGDIVLSHEYSEVYKLTLDIIDSLDLTMGSEKVSLEDYISFIEMGLVQKKLKMMPPGQDQIIIGDMERSRFGHIKALFMVGCSDDLLPGSASTQSIISDIDRTIIKDQGVQVAPTAREKVGFNRFYFYLHYTKPYERMYFTYSKTDGTNSSRNLSYFITDFGKTHNLTKLEVETDDIVTRLEALDKISSLFSRDNKDSDLDSLYNYLITYPEIEKKLNLILDAYEQKMTGDTLSKEFATKLFGQVIESSISKLNEYAMCPYEYFLEYGLYLSEREEYVYNRTDDGSLVHAVLSEFNNELEACGLKWKEISDEHIDEVLNAAVDKSLTGYRNTILSDSKRNAYIVTHLKDFVKIIIQFNRDRLAAGNFDIDGTEVRFNGHNDPALMVGLDEGKSLCIRGSVDRMDIAPGAHGDIINIIDYKTGSKDAKLKNIYDGCDLQLPIYAKAMMSKKNSDNLIGVTYSPVKNIVINDKDLKYDYSKESVKAAIYKELRGNGIYNKEDDIIINYGANADTYYKGIDKTKDGEFKKNSTVYSKDELKMIIDYAMLKAAQNGNKIANGIIPISPFKGTGSPCEYCKYGDVCKLSSGLGDYKLQTHTKMDDEEILALMKSQLYVDNDDNC